MLELSVSDLVPRFPQFRAAVARLDGLDLRAERPEALDRLIAGRARW